MVDLSLTIMGNDWIVIAFVALVMFLGSKRLPDVSRKLGRVMGEVNKTKNLVHDEFQKAKGEFTIPVQGPVSSEREKLEIMSKTIGIDYSSRSDNDLRNLIASKLGKPGQSSDQPSSKTN